MKTLISSIGLATLLSLFASGAQAEDIVIDSEYLKSNYVECNLYNTLIDELANIGAISSPELFKACQWSVNPDIDYSVTFTDYHDNYSYVALMLDIGEENTQLGEVYTGFIQFWNEGGVGGTLEQSNAFVKEQSDEINRLLAAGKQPIVTLGVETYGELDANKVMGGKVVAASYYQRDPVGTTQLRLSIVREEGYHMPSSKHPSNNYYTYAENYTLTWED